MSAIARKVWPASKLLPHFASDVEETRFWDEYDFE